MSSTRKLLPLWQALCAVFVLVCLPFRAESDPAAADKHQTFEGRLVYTSAELETAGWKLPPPPYPYSAVVRKEVGSGLVELTTGADGKIVKARMVKPIGYKDLDGAVASYALAAWHGVPSRKVITKVEFRLN